MPELTYRTAGESHGPALTALVEGMPAGLRVDTPRINAELRRRQGGYGRGGRMKIESDQIAVLAGVRRGLTTGMPIVLQIANRDSRLDEAPPLHRPRPGHADFAGAMKWRTEDCRDVLERASARETAARTAAGALAVCLLAEFGIECVGFVRSIGEVDAQIPDALLDDPAGLRAARGANDMYTPDAAVVEAMHETIRAAKQQGDTLGGIVEVRAFGVPPGLGSCASSQEKLDGRLMQAVGSVQAIKGVEIGLGFAAARLPGSRVHDPIYPEDAGRAPHRLGFTRSSNRAGGLEGGMTNGMPIVVRAAMKPISTLIRGLDSVNLQTRQPERCDYERSDVCAVPACSVIVENVVAFEIARALRDKLGGDTIDELKCAWDDYLRRA